MNIFSRQELRDSKLYLLFRGLRMSLNQRKAYQTWIEQDKPVPPPHLVKQRTLLEYKNRFQLTTLVETGTYYGDMIWAMRSHFQQLYSIELSETLHHRARRRFQRYQHIHLLQGDSGKLLESLVSGLAQPALFWLDSHYSAGETARGEKDTPIFEELNHILGNPHPGSVVLIDDARCFGADPAYPTLPNLKDYVLGRNPDLQFHVKHDLIRIFE